MNNQRKMPVLFAALFVIVAIVSMACAITTNTPGLSPNPLQPQATFTSAAPGQSNSLPTSPVVTNVPGGNGGASTPQAGNGSGPIPSTGNNGDVGQLAPPVTTAPKNLEDIYANSNPGVVSILVQVNQGGQSGAGAGSGFILSNKGYVVTNHHVIDGATTIVVRFYNNADTQAKVVGDDPNSDLAILQVANMAQGAHPLPLGDSNNIRVGDSVVAIGNPFALGTSMSSGIISAVGRTIPSGFTPFNIPQAIQTDAAINPGNSGGPLINMRGEIIGINAQIQTGGQNNGSVGVGFAIPINILKQIYPSLISKGSYSWPYLGVGQSVNALSVPAGNVQAQQGALLDQVTPGGPAANGGVQQGDVVVQADNQKITSFDDLLTYIAYKHPGDKVVLTVLRGGQQQQVTVTLGTRPQNLQPQQ